MPKKRTQKCTNANPNRHYQTNPFLPDKQLKLNHLCGAGWQPARRLPIGAALVRRLARQRFPNEPIYWRYKIET
jgi:hypothetical protein